MSEEEKSREEAKAEEYENVKTIKPHIQSPSLRSLRKVTPPEMLPIDEDYSDLAGDEDGESRLREKVASLKVRGCPTVSGLTSDD